MNLRQIDSRGREPEIATKKFSYDNARKYAPNLADKIIFALSAVLLVAGNIDSERLPIYGIGIAVAMTSLCARFMYKDFRSLEE